MFILKFLSVTFIKRLQ